MNNEARIKVLEAMLDAMTSKTALRHKAAVIAKIRALRAA